LSGGFDAKGRKVEKSSHARRLSKGKESKMQKVESYRSLYIG